MSTTTENEAQAAEPVATPRPEPEKPGAEVVHYRPRGSASLAAKVQYAKLLADSGLLPSAYRKQPANVLYAIEYGDMLGLPPMAAITGVHIIDGKPSASAGLISALVRRAGHKLRIRGDGKQAVAQIIRSDDPGFTYEATWTLDRAVTAGLCTLKDGKPYARDSKGRPLAWEKYPAAMLKARAITEVARDACEEALFGLHYTPEELGADVDGDGNVIHGEIVHEEPSPPPGRPAAQEWLEWAAGTARTLPDEDAGQKLWAKVTEKHDSGKITTADADRIRDAIKARWRELEAEAAATDAEVVEGEIADEPRPAGRQAPHVETDEDWKAEFISAASTAPTPDDVEGLRAELQAKLNDNGCAAEDAGALRDLLDARLADLDARSAA